jgi:Regulator of G protein signaling domain
MSGMSGMSEMSGMNEMSEMSECTTKALVIPVYAKNCTAIGLFAGETETPLLNFLSSLSLSLSLSLQFPVVKRIASGGRLDHRTTLLRAASHSAPHPPSMSISDLRILVRVERERVVFREFLSRLHCEEILDLWSACTDLLNTHTQRCGGGAAPAVADASATAARAHTNMLQSACEALYAEYVSPSAPQQVNLDHECVTAFEMLLRGESAGHSACGSQEERLCGALSDLQVKCELLMTHGYHRYLTETKQQASHASKLARGRANSAILSSHSDAQHDEQHPDTHSTHSSGPSVVPPPTHRRTLTASSLSPRNLAAQLSPRWARRKKHTAAKHARAHAHAPIHSRSGAETERCPTATRFQSPPAEQTPLVAGPPTSDVANESTRHCDAHLSRGDDSQVEAALGNMLTQLRVDLRVQSGARTPLFRQLADRQMQLRDQALQRLKVMQVMVKAQKNLCLTLETLAIESQVCCLLEAGMGIS